MCICNSKNYVVDLPHINIYTAMAEYKAKDYLRVQGGASRIGNIRIRWNSATQEELAWVYEEVENGSHYVEKIDKTNKSNNEESTIKKSNKKGKSSKEVSEEK